MASVCSICTSEVKWARVLGDDRVLCPACDVLEFTREYITLPGDYSKDKFAIMSWFEEFVRTVYGNLDDDGLRIVEDVFLELPKGSAKTTYVAILVLHALVTAHNTGTEIYSAATAKKQAANTYRAAEQMVNADYRLKSWLKIVPSMKRIYRRDDPTSFYEALSCDGNIHDGLAPQMVISDELHLWTTKRNKILYGVLRKSAKTKRKNPICIDITTAGEMDSSELCWKRHEYCRDWLAGVHKDRRFYGRIYAADQKRMDEEELYWTTREARVLANPAHEDNGGHIKDEVFAEMVQAALTDPVLRAEYKRYHLNYWGTNAEAVIDFPTWLTSGGPIDMRAWPTYDYEKVMSELDLVGDLCFLGLDVGSTNDLSALVAGFPPTAKRKRWAFLAWYWMPLCRVGIRKQKDQVPYDDWVGRGFIEGHEERETDPLMFLPRIKYCMQMFHVAEFCYDDWNAKNLIRRMEHGDENGNDALDVVCVDVEQNLAQLNEPTKWLLKAYQADKIWHSNNPVLNWNARNLGVKRDSNNNMKPQKVSEENAKKIDGVAAMITLLRRGLLVDAQHDQSSNVRGV